MLDKHSNECYNGCRHLFECARGGKYYEKNTWKFMERISFRRMRGHWHRRRKSTFEKNGRKTRNYKQHIDKGAKLRCRKLYWSVMWNPQFFFQKGLFKRVRICCIFSLWGNQFQKNINHWCGQLRGTISHRVKTIIRDYINRLFSFMFCRGP